MSTYDVVIAYRINPGLSNNAYTLKKWDKYKLSEVCMKSFLSSLKYVNFRVYAILDGCPQKYDALLRDLIPGNRLEIIQFPAIGNPATFLEQTRLLLTQNDSDVVYFAEDDYIYLEDSFSDMLEVIKRKDIDFVTPYDHPDYYEDRLHTEKPRASMNLHNYSSRIIFQKRHWRTVSSTCCTFLTTKSVLKKTSRYLGLYPKLGDYGMWTTLTRFRRFKKAPSRIITLKEYVFGLRQLLRGKSYTLWSPIPSIATHLAKHCLAPGIDWQAQIKKWE